MIFESHCNIINFPNTINTSPFYSTQLPNKDQTQNGPENAEQGKAKSIDSDIVDEKARDIVENTKRTDGKRVDDNKRRQSEHGYVLDEHP